MQIFKIKQTQQYFFQTGICKFHISAFVQACTFWQKLHSCIFRFASRHEFDAKTAFEAPFLPKIYRNLNYIAQKYTDFLQ